LANTNKKLNGLIDLYRVGHWNSGPLFIKIIIQIRSSPFQASCKAPWYSSFKFD